MFLAEDERCDAVFRLHLFHADVLKDLAGRGIARRLAIVSEEIARCVRGVLANEIAKESVLDAFGLNSATESEVRHARLAVIHDGESHGAIAAEAVFALENKRVEVRRIENLFQDRPIVTVAGKIHLVGALSELVHALNGRGSHWADMQFDTAAAQKIKVVAAESAGRLLPDGLFAIHGTAA